MRELTHVQCFRTGNGNWSFDDLKRVMLRSRIDDIAIWHATAFEQNICRSALPWIVRVLLMGATAPIAAPIGLAGAIAAFLIVGSDASVGRDLVAPSVANPVVAEASPVQTLAAAPLSPDIHASAGGDTAEPASVNTPAGKATAGLDDRDEAAQRAGVVQGARQVVARRTVKGAQRAGGVQGARQVVSRRTVEVAFHAQHAARQANEAARQAERTVEAALHVQHEARQANEAARRADLAARRAEQAARRAEQAASQAERAARNLGLRLQFPWNAITEPRSAS